MLKHLGLETRLDLDNSDIRMETNWNPSHHFLICTITHGFSQHDASKDGFYPNNRNYRLRKFEVSAYILWHVTHVTNYFTSLSEL